MSDQPTRPDAETAPPSATKPRSRPAPTAKRPPKKAEVADAHELDPEVVEHEREMAERGANQQGEGRLP